MTGRQLEIDKEDLLEKRTSQKYLNILTTVMASCWLPLNIVSVVQFGLRDNHCERFDHHARIYIVIVWVAYLPALFTPLICIRLLYNRVEFSKYFTLRYYKERFTSGSISSPASPAL